MSRRSKSLCIAIAAAALLFAEVTTSEARPRPARGTKGDFQANKTFGLGLMFGSPSGLSGKWFLGRDTALDFGLGFYGGRFYRHRSGLHVFADFLWHPVVLAKPDPFHVPLYIGIGGRLWDHSWRDDNYRDHMHLGLRVPAGLALDFNRVPLDIFVEVAFIMDFLFDDYRDEGAVYADLQAAFGIRYWFE